MKGYEIRAGDEFREGEKLIYTVLTDAEKVDTKLLEDADGPLVRCMVRYAADGGHSPRYYDTYADTLVTRPKA